MTLANPAPLKDVQHFLGQSQTRYRGRDDVWVMRLPATSTLAVVTTRNQIFAAPVGVCRKRSSAKCAVPVQALVTNAGIANACTGKQGEQAALAICRSVAQQFAVPEQAVFPASTGVIGEQIEVEALTQTIRTLRSGGWAEAAAAIMTTDAFPKISSRQVGPGRVVGIAKGAGMIAPDMATMLAYIVTDIAIEDSQLPSILIRAVDQSFNRAVVDGDCSTNDTVFLISTHQHPTADIKPVESAIAEVCLDLAQQIVKDGEGAKKFVTIKVRGAADSLQAKQLAEKIATSLLVKTAFAGEEANWGRVVAVVGRSKAVFSQEMTIKIGSYLVYANGTANPTLDIHALEQALRQPNLTVEVDCKAGSAEATVYTTDLNHRYIDINASYRS